MRLLCIAAAILAAATSRADCAYPSIECGLRLVADLPSLSTPLNLSNWGVLYYEFGQVDRFDLSGTDWTYTELNGPITETAQGVENDALNGGIGKWRHNDQAEVDTGFVYQLDAAGSNGGAAYLPLAGREVIFAARISGLDVTDAATCIGLAEQHAISPLLTGHAAGVISDNHICFHLICRISPQCGPWTASYAPLLFSTSGVTNANVEVTDLKLLVHDNTYYTVAFHLIGDRLWKAYAFVSGKWVGLESGTLAVPMDGVIFPTIASWDIGTANGQSLDWMLMAVLR